MKKTLSFLEPYNKSSQNYPFFSNLQTLSPSLNLLLFQNYLNFINIYLFIIFYKVKVELNNGKSNF